MMFEFLPKALQLLSTQYNARFAMGLQKYIDLRSLPTPPTLHQSEQNAFDPGSFQNSNISKVLKRNWVNSHRL